MANDFSSDTRCKALWSFENGALTTDSSGNGNTLTDVNTVSSITTVGNFKEGSGAADFERDNGEYLKIDDANLCAGFPLKNGDATKQGTFAFWTKLESTGNGWLFCKGAWTNNITFGAMVDGDGKIHFYCGRAGAGDNGTLQEIITGQLLITGRWYHIAVIVNGAGSSRSIRLIIYDDTLGYVTNDFTYPLNYDLYDGTASFNIGCRSDVTQFHDGIMDEFVVFNAMLNRAEVAAIRAGTYSEPISASASVSKADLISDSRCKGLWCMDSGALGTDSSGEGNDLSIVRSVTEALDHLEGTGAASFVDGTTQETASYMERADADLSAGFPFKSGDTKKLITCCFFVYLNSVAGENWLISKWDDVPVSDLRTFTIGTVVGGGLRVGVALDSSTTWWFSSGYTLSVGEWYFVAVSISYTAKTVEVYVYKVSDDTSYIRFETTANTLPAATAARLTIGSGGSMDAAGTDGIIDYVSVFNELLSIDEVDAIRAGIVYGTPGSTAKPLIIFM